MSSYYVETSRIPSPANANFLERKIMDLKLPEVIHTHAHTYPTFLSLRMKLWFYYCEDAVAEDVHVFILRFLNFSSVGSFVYTRIRNCLLWSKSGWDESAFGLHLGPTRQ